MTKATGAIQCPAQAMIRERLDYWTERRRLLVEFRNAVSACDGKTETTARLPDRVSELVAELTKPAPAGCYAERPQYRSKRRGDRIPRIDSSQVQPSIRHCESMIHDLDEASTFDYGPYLAAARLARIEREKLRGPAAAVVMNLPASAFD